MRNIDQLHPGLIAVIPKLLAQCSVQGLKAGIGECLRTTSEQDALYAQGRTKPGHVVTNARGSALQSQHQWGIAFDFYRNDGKGAFNDTDGFFYKVGAVAKRLGLAWGGDWRDIKDKPHLYLPEYSPDGTTAWLKNTYGMPEKFFNGWRPGGTIVTSDTHGEVVKPFCGYYIAKFISPLPISVTAGSSGVAAVIPPVKQGDNEYLCAFGLAGKCGDATGIYTQVRGEAPFKQFVLKVS